MIQEYAKGFYAIVNIKPDTRRILKNKIAVIRLFTSIAIHFKKRKERSRVKALKKSKTRECCVKIT